MFRYNPEKFPP